MSASPQSKHYRVIYADPPWTFATYSRKGKGRSPEAYYDCMSLADIKALPVAEWAADDCVLLMWATDPLLEKAFDIIHAWGFTYKTVGFYWAKLRKPELFYNDRSFFTGLGFWTRANPGALPARDARQAASPPGRCPQADRVAAARAQPQTGRGLRAHRSPVRRALSRNVRPSSAGPAGTGGATRPTHPETGQRRWRADSYPDAPRPPS